MNLDNNQSQESQNGLAGSQQQSQQQSSGKPEPTPVNTDDDIKEKDLKRNFLFGNDTDSQVSEGKPMGGHKFGEESHPPTGDAPNNPSQNAGYTNAFLAKTEPSEEYTDNNNFKPESQQGAPDYDQHTKSTDAPPSDQKPEETPVEHNPANTEPNHQTTGYGDNDPNSPEYLERIEQQKVGGG